MQGTLTPGAGHLTVQTTYLAVNEPMLFSARNELQDLYLVSYADMTDHGEVWLIVRVSEDRLAEFEANRRTLRLMFLEPELGGVLRVEFDDRPGHAPYYAWLPPSHPDVLSALPQEAT